jgi:hypothetical protein
MANLQISGEIFTFGAGYFLAMIGACTDLSKELIRES